MHSAPNSTSIPPGSHDASTTSGADHILTGTGTAPGIAIGSAYRYSNATETVSTTLIDPEETEAEVKLFNEAAERAADDIERIAQMAGKKVGGDDAAIFEAQLMMLRDDVVLDDVRERIRTEHVDAASALHQVFVENLRRLQDSDDPYLQARAADVREVETRILQALRRTRFVASVPPKSIVVSNSLTAADVIRFSRQRVRGIVTEDGGPTSHVSILARALDIPALAGVNGAMDAVEEGDTVVLDGRGGDLIVRPTPATLSDYKSRQARYENIQAQQSHLARLPCRTADGHSVTLQANVEFGEELQALSRYGAEGIGLLRTEILFLLQSNATLSEDDQYDVYCRAVEASGDAGATIRLLDLGGDKALPRGAQEANPFLGWRGVRVLMDRPELLRPQIRATLRAAAHGPVRVLIPMVSSVDEIDYVRSMLDEEAQTLSDEGVEHARDVPLGMMVEIPCAAVQALHFARHADFFSVGTNDLTQYVLAVDRGNEHVSSRFDALHPAVLTLVRQTIAAGEGAGIPVGLCGELASHPESLPLLVGLGFDSLSATPSYLPEMKRVLRSVTYPDARALADQTLNDASPEAVRERVRAWIQDRPDVCEAVYGPDPCGSERPAA